jgi:hypothetical protein
MEILFVLQLCAGDEYAGEEYGDQERNDWTYM